MVTVIQEQPPAWQQALTGLAAGITRGFEAGMQHRMQEEQRQRQALEQIGLQLGDPDFIEQAELFDAPTRAALIPAFQRKIDRKKQIAERERMQALQEPIQKAQQFVDVADQMLGGVLTKEERNKLVSHNLLRTQLGMTDEQADRMVYQRETGPPPKYTIDDINEKKEELARLQGWVARWEDPNEKRRMEDAGVTEAFIEGIKPQIRNLRFQIEQMYEGNENLDPHEAKAHVHRTAQRQFADILPQYAAEHGTRPNEPLSAVEWAGMMDRIEANLLEEGWSKSVIEDALYELPGEFPHLLQEDVSMSDIMSYRHAEEEGGQVWHERFRQAVGGWITGETVEPEHRSLEDAVDFTDSILDITRGGGSPTTGVRTTPTEMIGAVHNLPRGSYWIQGHVTMINDEGWRALRERFRDEEEAMAYMNMHGIRYEGHE